MTMATMRKLEVVHKELEQLNKWHKNNVSSTPAQVNIASFSVGPFQGKKVEKYVVKQLIRKCACGGGGISVNDNLFVPQNMFTILQLCHFVNIQGVAPKDKPK